jgi:hypothetical protein
MSAITETYTFSGSGEDFGPKKGSGLIVLHTFENSDPLKNLMKDARAGAIWQDRNDVIGAYNRIIAVDGVLGCVPDDHISGGMAAGTSVYKPLAWLYAEQPAHKINDGNSYAQQLCAMGQRAYYDANGWPAGIIDGYARSIIDEEERTGLTLGSGLTLANHADFQPGNRSDAGGAKPLVLERYAQLKGLETDMRLLESFQTLMQGRLREGTGIVRLPLWDAELITVLPAGTWLPIVHYMPDQGGYTIDGVAGNDWLAVAIGDQIGYVEAPLVVDRFITAAGQEVVPPAPAPEPVDVAQVAADARAALNAAIDAWVATRPR